MALKPERDLTRFEIHRQPDDATCGPTCLHAVYRFFGDERPLGELTSEIDRVEGGGTLGVHLGLHALERGYRARIVTWNLNVFDPTWFAKGAGPLADKLRARAEAKRLVGRRATDEKLAEACLAYTRFVEAGGRVEFDDLDGALLRRFLKRGLPVLTGLSATFLYREPREHLDGKEDDVAGDPAGHFVVLTGYSKRTRTVTVTDPMHPNPLSVVHTYTVPMQRLIGAIYLGVLTYDANLLVVEPRNPSGSR